MDETNKRSLLLPLVGVLVFVTAGVGYYYFNYVAVSEQVIETEPESYPVESLNILNYGLNGAITDEFPLSGVLYFTSTEDSLVNAESYQRNIYSLDLSSDTLSKVTDEGWYGEVAVIDTEHMVALIESPTDNNGADNLVPAGVLLDSEMYFPLVTNPGWSDKDLVISPDEESLAFAQQLGPDQYYSDFTNWQVVVTNTHENTEIIIVNAVSPAWFPDSTKLAVMKADGVYVYDLTTNTETLVLATYSGLDPNTKITFSPNGERFILVIPGLNAVVAGLYNETTNEVTEFGRFFSDEYRYFEPEFSPDGNTYALLRVSGEVTGNDPVTLEVRAFINANPVYTKTLDTLKVLATTLGDWVDFNVNE